MANINQFAGLQVGCVTNAASFTGLDNFVCVCMCAKHMSYTAAFKLKAIVFAEKSGNRKAERESEYVKSSCGSGERRISS